MAWKNLKQRSLADSMIVTHEAVKELNELICWSRVEQHLSQIHAKPRGKKAWPPLLMLKALLLQSWYNLSDPQLEKQLARDLLFRRFVELDLSELQTGIYFLTCTGWGWGGSYLGMLELARWGSDSENRPGWEGGSA